MTLRPENYFGYRGARIYSQMVIVQRKACVGAGMPDMREKLRLLRLIMPDIIKEVYFVLTIVRTE